MNRMGIVYEIHRNKAVVMTPDSDFLVVKRRSDMYLGQQVKFAIQDVCKPISSIYKYASIASGIAAVFILVFMFFNFSFYNDTVYGFINVDINPSMEFVVDKEFEVLEVKSLNGDAELISKELNVKGKPLYEAISEFLDKSGSHGFIDLTDNNVVLVSACLNNKSKEYLNNSQNEERDLNIFLLSLNEKIAKERGGNITSKVMKVTSEERKAAQEISLSMGRYYLLKKANEQGLELSSEDIAKEKVSELLAVIEIDNSVTPTPASTSAFHHTDNPQSTNADVFTPLPTKRLSTSGLLVPSPTPKPNVKSTPSGSITPTAEIKITPLPTATNNTSDKGSIRLQLHSSERNIISNTVHFDINIINTGDHTIDLKDVKVRYYFTKEGSSPLKCWIYYFGKGKKEDVKITFHNKKGSTNGEMYMEAAFKSGVIKPGETVNVQSEFAKEDWSDFDQGNDYSYSEKENKYTDWNRITGYISDTLVWGIEP